MRRINQRLNRPNSLSLTARKAAAAKDGTCGAVRIVGGIWRRTPLQVASRPGLRPTPERVRETVFDWMGHLFGTLSGRVVLDLFAGSGAMGLEAASRGATEVDLVERSRESAARIGEALKRLKAPASVRVHCADAFAFLAEVPEGRYDWVVIDPPYAEDLQLRAIAAALPALRGDGLIYVEQPKTPVSAEALRRLGLTRVRLSVAGEVVFELLTRMDSPMAAQAKFAKKLLRDMQQKGVEL